MEVNKSTEKYRFARRGNRIVIRTTLARIQSWVAAGYRSADPADQTSGK
jgi:hypothetical protein